jgi:8-amino-7-oxononanoate synthase
MLEQKLAAFTGFPRALLFSTGYMANLASCRRSSARGDAVFADKLNHASLIDAVQLSRADSQRYAARRSRRARAAMLAASNAKRKLILTDAVFSMDGDIAPLPGCSNSPNASTPGW